ncbi:integrative conjugative element protein, RAQPRD family [Salmonella enterica]|nr:integrative conjugative element protein, RAQPRD family [Salmonella enterica]
MYHVTRLALKGVLFMSCSCLPVFAQASEKDELAQVIRQLDQVQASLERARALSAQSADDGRFYFDYVRASQDIVSMKQGISQYLDPSRAQPRDAAAVEGRYRQERAQ